MGTRSPDLHGHPEEGTIVQVTKPVDLVQLGRELAAASVVVGGLALERSDPTEPDPSPEHPAELLQYDPDGYPAELPPEAAPVVDAHTAPPPFVRYVGTAEQRSILRTTDATLHEIVRIPTQVKHVYLAEVAISAVDAGDGTTKATEARLSFKRTAAGLAQVGSTVPLWTTQDAGASGWAIVAAPSGTDLQIGVRGAAGRTIDWAAVVRLEEHAPEGL